MSEISPVAPYKEVVFKGRTYKRPGISPARAAMAEAKRKTLQPGMPGTDEKPIIQDGIPYVYSSNGKLVRRLDFDPETMEMFILKPPAPLSDEQIQMLKTVMKMSVV